MASIEDILYEAYELGISENVFKKVTELRRKEKYKFVDLTTVYTKAFNKVLKKSIKHKKQLI